MSGESAQRFGIFAAVLRLDCDVNELFVLAQPFAVNVWRARFVRDDRYNRRELRVNTDQTQPPLQSGQPIRDARRNKPAGVLRTEAVRGGAGKSLVASEVERDRAVEAAALSVLRRADSDAAAVFRSPDPPALRVFWGNGRACRCDAHVQLLAQRDRP